MARTWTLPLAIFLTLSSAAQENKTWIVHFALGSSEPDATEKNSLLKICDRPDIEQVQDVTIRGWADPRGNSTENYALSEARAQRVGQLLQSTCLAERQITILAMGVKDAEQIGDEMSYAEDRRVEVVLAFSSVPTARTYRLRHPSVHPLMASLDQEPERYLVNSESAIERTMSDGVRLSIPANAMLDADGNPIHGTVELCYRSFPDPYAIIASGIPMFIRTDTGTVHFESAGMYEVYASQQGQPLSLRDGAQITLQQPEAPALEEDFIGWRLDSSGAWVAEGQLTAVQPSASQSNVVTAAASRYWQELFRLESTSIPDSTMFDDRRRDANYARTIAFYNASAGTKWRRNLEQLKQTPSEVPKISVVGHRGMYDPDHIAFEIAMAASSAKQLPEWRHLPYGAVWEYRGAEPRKLFKRLYGSRHLFQDVDLVMEPGMDDGVLRLKENGEWLEIAVSAKADRRTPSEAARWDRSIIKYHRALKQTQQRFDRLLAVDVAQYNRMRIKFSSMAWTEARSAMLDSERTMDLESWEVYAATRRPAMRWADATTQRDLDLVQTTFGLSSFGVHNIDRIMKMKRQLNVLASTVGPEGEPFPWVHAFAVLRNENAVVTYWGTGGGKNDQLLVSPGNMKSLFLVDAEGNVACADVSPLNANNAVVILKATPLKDVKKLEDLSAEVRP